MIDFDSAKSMNKALQSMTSIAVLGGTLSLDVPSDGDQSVPGCSLLLLNIPSYISDFTKLLGGIKLKNKRKGFRVLENRGTF